MGRSFRFLETLGSGAFGEVLLAEIADDDDFVQTLAVKWLHARHSDDPELMGRLRDEARLLGLLHHPNVVRVQGLTRIDNRLAVLMEPVEGHDLSDTTLPPRAAAEVVAAVSDALEAAWERVPPGRTAPLRVVHRDIKPSNVMVTPRGQVKVMDFGVARATFEAREAQTRSQQYGTARYMAPERWLEGVAEAPSDVFSLGVTLIELAGGAPVGRPRLSRDGFDADLAEALARLDAWPALKTLAADMVRFVPGDRPTAGQVRDRALALELDGPDLRGWAASLGARPRPPGPLTGTVVLEDTNADTFALGDPSSGRATATTKPVSASGRSGDAPVPGLTASGGVPRAVPPEAAPAPGPRPRRAFLAGLAGAAGVVAALWVGWTASGPGVTAPRPLPEPVPIGSIEGAGGDAPVRDVVPGVEPTPTPAPPAPRPVPVAAPALDPAPAEPVAAARVAVTFRLDPGVEVRSASGTWSRGRQTVLLPADSLLRVEVHHGAGRFECTIPVGGAPATWHVGVDRGCTLEG